MTKKRKVTVEQVKSDKGEVIGARKTVTKTDRNDIVKKHKVKFKGDKDYLQGRRETVLRADQKRRRDEHLKSDPGITDATKRKIAASPIILTDKEKKNKEIVKTVKTKDELGKRVESKGVRTNAVYSSRSVSKTTKDQRAQELTKRRDAEVKKKEDSFRGIKHSSGAIQTRQKTTEPAKGKKSKNK